ncbi:protein EMSY-LIKE 3-like isoform X1 [Sesamum indicum]|uniref:Protein EMSY-LIKE 3-like isoform X1 n=2 Tax=Sesamum indicum TaxID=4182 RepID=A0A6I9T6L9_SESIN|nr:protein EMSY-LIKE 3-like isoform X1 [Sesamum indicum]
MEYGVVDSSGTDDDNPQPLYNRIPVGSRVAGNGRSFVASAPYQKMQTDIESEIHNLEQIAYGAVLRAFKAQSDALTWEKEGLITELRKELRVSDDEHRELLTEVNADDLIRRIREWREAGGNRNVAPSVPQHVNNQLPSPTVSASRKRQKTSMSGNPFGSASQSLHPPSVAGTAQTLSSAGKWVPTSGIGGRRPNAGQPAFTPSKPMQYQFTDHVSSGAPMDDPSESLRDPLIGRRVMIRWPADNNFYEAVINEYNPVDGRHSLVYDSNTPNATVEWVNIKEVPPEDIRWVGDEPVISRLGEAGAPNLGRGRASSMNQFANEIRPSRNGVTKDDYEEIEILHTDTLIKKVEKVLDASNPDILEIDKAKKMLKEHEQTLIEVIQKLADACDSVLIFASDDERPSAPGHSTGTQHNVDHRGPSHEPEITGRASSYELARG